MPQILHSNLVHGFAFIRPTGWRAGVGLEPPQTFFLYKFPLMMDSIYNEIRAKEPRLEEPLCLCGSNKRLAKLSAAFTTTSALQSPCRILEGNPMFGLESLFPHGSLFKFYGKINPMKHKTIPIRQSSRFDLGSQR